MATTHVHVPLHVSTYHNIPPSPTLTNPDMILPFDEPNENFPTLTAHPSSIAIQADLVSNSSFDGNAPSARARSDSDAEVGIATAVTLPMLVKGPTPTTIPAVAAIAYNGYEHGAPLSDIGEEVEEVTMRSRGSSPDETRDAAKQHGLRHKKRLSNLSTSSTGSDKNEQWERFDTSQLMSDRVAADIAQARDAVDDNEESGSRRNSKEMEEELVALNDRAEKILENARKRLSSMEDNLTKARHSILLSPRSIPNMHELGHQPAGGLYRSISQSAQNRRSRGLFPSLKTMGLQHARTGSEMVSTNGLKRLSGVPEPRSASAMDFSPARYGVGFITDPKPSPPSKLSTHSPSSSRSYNSPLRILSEEVEAETPSTVKTSPDNSGPATDSFLQTRGLGIHASGTKAQEDLTLAYESSESPTSLNRSSSQASTRSARELRDQITEMKNRIADLKTKAQADSLRRRSMQSLRTPSPFLQSNVVNGHGAEGWYTGAGPSNSQPSTTPTGQPPHPWRTPPRSSHERKDSALESITDQPTPPPQVVEDQIESETEHNPITPVAARLLNITDGTPFHPTSARTDQNTPNLVNRNVDTYPSGQERSESPIQGMAYGDVDQDFDTSEDEEQVASNEEEQIYLNEVLEESLHDMGTQVPAIPGEYLIGDELIDLQADTAERHEDRLDAFDYENMFLHSAMGTIRGEEQSDDSDNESLVTSREDVQTPTAVFEEEEVDDTASFEEQSEDEDPALSTAHSRSFSRSMPTAIHRLGWSPINTSNQPRSPLRDAANSRLTSSSQPWAHISRTKSMETVSSVASYQTAVENDGEDDDEDEDFHDEILNWGNAPPHHHSNGHSQVPANGISAKAQNVLGWPTPPTATSSARHSSYVRPQQANLVPGHYRSTSASSSRSAPGRSPLSTVQYSAFPFTTAAPVQPPPNQPLPPPPQVQTQAAVTHQANTEILMESLIKLADPEFSIESTGRTNFADIDKELVLGLLRAVGGVCDGVLRAQHGRKGNVVKDLRTRLVNARDVLVGMSVVEQEGLEEIMEDDEDEE